MAKIVQTLTRASDEYEVDVAQSLIRDLDAVIENGLLREYRIGPLTENLNGS